MPDNVVANGLGRLLEHIASRAGLHSRRWVGAWLAGVLAVTALAAVFHAPTAAYLILGLVTTTALFADDRPGGAE